MLICGQEFEFSLMNANDLDRFEDANEQMQNRSAEESEQFQSGGVRLGDHARAQARIAMDCIDEILGAGASDRLGLNENYMAPIYDVIEELGNAFAAEKQRYAAKPAQPMNREQRRAEQKARQRTRTAGRIVEAQQAPPHGPYGHRPYGPCRRRPDGGAGGCAGIRKAENRAADRCPAGCECPAG